MAEAQLASPDAAAADAAPVLPCWATSDDVAELILASEALTLRDRCRAAAVCRGWRRVCDTCSALWERVSDEEVDTSSPEKVASFLWWCACRAGAIRCLRLQLKDFNQALPYPHDDDAHKKMRKVSSSLGFMLGVCGGSLEELVLGNPWACDDFVGVLPDHPYWVTPLKRLRTLEIGRSEEASYAPALLHALRTHCPELRNLALAPRRGDDVAAVLPPLGLERLEFNGYNLLSPTLTQLTRLTHLCWGVYDPIEDWRVVAALTSLQTMTVGASYEEEGRLPENISTLRNLRELSLELDPQYDDFFWWEGLEHLALLPSLTKLSFSGHFHADFPQPLAGLTTLRCLDLSAVERHVNDAGVAALPAGGYLRHVTELHAGWAALVASAAALQSAQALQVITVAEDKSEDDAAVEVEDEDGAGAALWRSMALLPRLRRVKLCGGWGGPKSMLALFQLGAARPALEVVVE